MTHELEPEALKAAHTVAMEVFNGDITRYVMWRDHLDAIVTAAIAAYLSSTKSEPVAVPAFHDAARRTLDSLIAAGWEVNGYAIMKGDERRGFIDFGGFVGWWLPEYYKGHTSEAADPALSKGGAQ